MGRRATIPALTYDMLQMGWWTASKPLAAYNTVTAYTLSAMYDVHRMDLYLWDATSSTPAAAYYGSFFRDANEGPSFYNTDGTLKTSVTWSNAATSWAKTTVPVVYYIDHRGSVLHMAYGGLIGTSTVTVDPGDGGPGGIDDCFLLDTPIMGRDFLKTIGSMSMSDVIMGYHFEKVGEVVAENPVRALLLHKPKKEGRPVVKVKANRNHPVGFTATGIHNVYTMEKGYIPASFLRAGMHLFSVPLQQPIEILSVEDGTYYGPVMNLMTKTVNYAITELGFLVHNEKCSWGQCCGVNRPGEPC